VLLVPAEVDDSPASPVLRKNSFTSQAQGWRRELEVQVTDAAGAFRFELARPGSYALQAVLGHTPLSVATAALTVNAEGPGEELELVLPRGGRLQGRVLGSPEATLAGLRLWARPVDAASPPLGYDPGLLTAVALGADGSFELGPLAAGSVRVFLVLPESSVDHPAFSNDRLGGAVELGTAEVLEDGTTRADFACAGLPGRLALTVLVNDAPAAGLDVTLRPADAQDPTELRAVTDAGGTCAPILAFPGSYRVHLRDVERGWSTWLAEAVLLPGASSVERTLVLTVAHETLFCTQAGGEPLVDEWVTVLVASDPYSSWEQVTARRTDEHGRLELALPPGEYALQRGRLEPFRDPPTSVPLTWTESGPLETRIQL
jgi:hypothetical protein